VWVLCCPSALANSATSYQGQSLRSVLQQLSPRLSFIYNSQLIADDLVVMREPRARDGIALAREVLAQHGLSVSEVAPNVYTVIAKTNAEPPRQAADRSQVALEEIVVQASRYRLAVTERHGGSHTFLTQDQLNSLPRLGDEPLRAVQRLPGAASNGFSSMAPIRGGESNEVGIVLDGLRLYEPFHLKNFLSPVSLLDSRVLAGMDVYSGAFPVIFGERMSGIIDAHSVHPQDPRYIELGLSVFHASALGSTAFADQRGHALLAARRSNLGELARLSENEFGEPTYSDGFLRLDYDLSAATSASFNTLVSSDRISARRSSDRERANAEYRNYYGWGTLTHDWESGASTRLIASYTSVENERQGTVDDPGVRSAQVSDEREFHMVGLRADHDFRLGGLAHRVGAEVRHLNATYDYRSQMRFEVGYPFPGSQAMELSRAFAPDPEGYESMVYWDIRWKLAPRWTLQAGVRVETQTYDHLGDAAQWSPRFNLLYEPSSRTRWRASWGRFSQAHTINELQVEDGVEHFYRAQRAEHTVVGFEHSFATHLDVRVEAYRKHYSNPNPRFENVLDPLVLLPEVGYDRVAVDPSAAQAYGIEVLLNVREWRGLSAWLGYAWSRAEDRIDGRELPRSWDQRHSVTAGVRWSGGPWDVTLTDSYHSGWPTTAVELTGATDPNVPAAALGSRNAERLSHYNSLDLRVTRTFALSRGELDVFVEATNATSRLNPCCVSYSVTRQPDGTSTLGRDVDHWLPLIPSFGVLWRY
jgi:hypothetical protein